MVVAAEFVMDSSFAIPWIFRSEKNRLSDEAWESLVEQTATAHVPALWSMEMTNVTLRGPRGNAPKPSAEEVDAFFTILRRLPLRVHHQSLELFLGEAAPLMVKHSLTCYDSAYLLLARNLGLPLATCDGKLRAAAVAERVEVMS